MITRLMIQRGSLRQPPVLPAFHFANGCLQLTDFFLRIALSILVAEENPHFTSKKENLQEKKFWPELLYIYSEQIYIILESFPEPVLYYTNVPHFMNIFRIIWPGDSSNY